MFSLARQQEKCHLAWQIQPWKASTAVSAHESCTVCRTYTFNLLAVNTVNSVSVGIQFSISCRHKTYFLFTLYGRSAILHYCIDMKFHNTVIREDFLHILILESLDDWCYCEPAPLWLYTLVACISSQIIALLGLSHPPPLPLPPFATLSYVDIYCSKTKGLY